MKLHLLEAIGSALIVGLGQLIKGDGKKGIILLLIFYFALPAAVYLSLLANARSFPYILGFTFISGIMVWIYNVGDALLK